MRGGLVAIVATAGALSALVILSLSMNDPSWRLFDSTSVPAPVYEPAADLSGALASAPSALGNRDSGAVTQKPALPGALDPAAGEAREAGTERLPAIALVPVSRIDSGYDVRLDNSPAAAYELPAAARLLPVGAMPEDAAVVVAAQSAPLPPIGTALRDSAPGAEGTMLADGTLAPFDTPAPPAQPRLMATPETESGLALARAERIDVQRQLALAGFDPAGFDGVFGPRTRGAIADFQTAWGFPASGYLDGAVVAELNGRTENAYQALRRQAAAAPSAAPDLAAAPETSQVARSDAAGGCARRSDGRIVERQSLACDIAGFSEKFIVSFSRDTRVEPSEAGAAATMTPVPRTGRDH